MTRRSTECTESSTAWPSNQDRLRAAAFRVALGLTLFADILHLYFYQAVFAGAQRWHIPVGALLVLWLSVLLCMTAGYHARFAVVANYCFCVLVLGVLVSFVKFSQVAGDSIAIGASLVAVLLPCDAALAWGRTSLGKRIFPYVGRPQWVLAAFLSSIYIDSGLHKLTSPMWRSGYGAIIPMGLPSIVWIKTGWLALFPTWFLRCFDWGVVGFELLFVLFYVWRRTRVLAVLVGIALHVGIAVLYPIPVFAGLMLVMYAGLLPDAWYAPLEKLDAWMAIKAFKVSSRHTQSRVRPFASARLQTVIFALWACSVAVVYETKLLTRPPGMAVAKLARRGIYALTGIVSHEVFSDSQFEHYTYQLRLMPSDSTDDAACVPYSRGGLFAWYVRDRLWDDWWKRTQAPDVPIQDAEKRMGAWASAHWVASSGVTNIRIEARPQEVEMDRVDTALFSRNFARRWHTIGYVELRRGTSPIVRWVIPPSPREVLLGDYVSRINDDEMVSLHANPAVVP